MANRYLAKKGSPHVYDWTEALAAHVDVYEIDEETAAAMRAGDISAGETAQLRRVASVLKSAAGAMESAVEERSNTAGGVDAAIEALQVMELPQIKEIASQMGVDIPAEATEVHARELMTTAFNNLRVLANAPGGEELVKQATSFVPATGT
jgi:hypothetical protein